MVTVFNLISQQADHLYLFGYPPKIYRNPRGPNSMIEPSLNSCDFQIFHLSTRKFS